MPAPPNRAPSTLASILISIASELGAEIVLDPGWQYAGQITFSTGKRAYFRGPSLDINPHGSSEIAKDKDYAAFFMRRMGFPAVSGETFFSTEWADEIGSSRDAEAAVIGARDMGYPLVVKPNSTSQGRGVHVVSCETQFRDAIAFCLKLDRVVLVQPFVRGRDYRVVVLGSEVISAYQRTPLSIVGDGVSSIAGLLARKQEYWLAERRPIKISGDDARVTDCLRRQGRDLSAIPADGERIHLLDVANLSTGGDADDVTGRIDPSIEKLCIDVTREMGLRLCGVDLIIDGDVCGKFDRAHILEINSSPGLDNYAMLGPAQWQRVRGLYGKVLKHIERHA